MYFLPIVFFFNTEEC